MEKKEIRVFDQSEQVVHKVLEELFQARWVETSVPESIDYGKAYYRLPRSKNKARFATCRLADHSRVLVILITTDGSRDILPAPGWIAVAAMLEKQGEENFTLAHEFEPRSHWRIDRKTDYVALYEYRREDQQ